MLTFRLIEPRDISLCFEWANDPSVRENSHNKNPIAYNDHEKWFNNKLVDKNSMFYIIELNNNPVGQIRFDGEETMVISYLLASNIRGKGYGFDVLIGGINKLLEDSNIVNKIIGYVLKSNIASYKTFIKAGFELDTSDFEFPESFKFIMNLKKD